MFNFTAIQKAIIHDLKPICMNNYLILNEINILPKELIKSIISYTFEISDEMILLNEDIIFLEEYSLFDLIHICYNPFSINIDLLINNIDILFPEYNNFLNLNINNLHRKPLTKSYDEYGSLVRKCVKNLYVLNNDIFDILFRRYCDQRDSNIYISAVIRKI